MNKKTIAKNGKRFVEDLLLWTRRNLVEKQIDPRRDSTLLSWATYSPWLLDKDFMIVHGKISDYTLVDIYRCYELWHLLEQTTSVEGDILEVGTWRGGTGALLGYRAKQLELPAVNFLCDTFEGVVKTSSDDASYSGGEHADTSVPVVNDLIRDLDLNNTEILKGIFPEDTGHLVQDRKFRFCHIDVDVYQSGKDVLHWVWDRLSVGGIVVFDDFGFPSTRGITKLVHEEEHHANRVCIQNLNGHAVFVKKN